MLPSDVRALLIEAPPGRHLAQLHRDAESLVPSVGLYMAAGLERGAGVVVIATPGHAEGIMDYVDRAGLDVSGLRRGGRFVVMDAAAMLSRVMRRGLPDWTEFHRVIGSTIRHLQSAGRGTCRAYGEMVSVLWARGRHRAAIQLEECWNALLEPLAFSMFCSYMLDSHDHRCYHEPLGEIGRTHSEIVTGDDDEAFRDALDKASRDVFGVPLSETLSASQEEGRPGEHRLPTGQRTMLWIQRALPASSADVLNRARVYLTRHLQAS